MENTNYIIETNQVCRSFGPKMVLKEISLRFADQKIYGLFGRNGAGKTTLLNVITARIFADSGSVIFFGKHTSQNARIMAENCCYMPEKHYFPPRLKVKKLLDLGKTSFPNFSQSSAEKLCRLFNLDQKQPYGQLSRGQQSVLRIVLGLAANARITIFDEPVLGLDTVARDRFYSALVEEFSRNPRLFIIATHLIEESAGLYNEAVIIDQGKVIRQAAVEELLAAVFYVAGKSERVDQFIQNRKLLSCQVVNGLKTAVVEGDYQLEKPVPGLTFSPLTIRKLFIHLTQSQGEKESFK